MTFKEYMGQMWELTHLAKRTLERIEETRSQAEKMTTTLSHAPFWGTPADGVNAMDVLVDLQVMYVETLRRIYRKQRELEAFIDRVGDDKQRMVLRLRYIDMHRWELIAVELNYDMRWVFRIHGTALEAARLLYAEMEGTEDADTN